jgi:F-type H+-transporting ATPase subunit delta
MDRDRHTAHVQSAVPLDGDLRTSIAADVVRLFGKGVEPSFTEDPTLVGGIRVRVGSDVYDGSVRARLAAIEARL